MQKRILLPKKIQICGIISMWEDVNDKQLFHPFL